MKEYELEYGTAGLEIRRDCIRPGERVLIVDDVLATGGTATCAASLFNALNVQIVGFAFLLSLSFLKGEEELAKYKTVSLVRYE
jgi:adenine phosphoribosyltransferase